MSATFDLKNPIALGAHLSAFVGKERELNADNVKKSLTDRSLKYARVGVDVGIHGITFGA
jgi:hypothetical protein